MEEIANIYELPMIRSPPKLCTDNAAMIAWMGWELLNCGQDVDLMEMGDGVIPLTCIPLGSHAEDYINIKGKTLRSIRQQFKRSK
jgi:hypothetical protein